MNYVNCINKNCTVLCVVKINRIPWAANSENVFSDVHLAKIKISLCIGAVWSESSWDAFWIAKDAKFSHEDNEDWSDCADVQDDLSLCWANMSEGTFSHIKAL